MLCYKFNLNLVEFLLNTTILMQKVFHESFHVKSTKIEKNFFAVVSSIFKFLPLGDMFK